MVSSLHNLLYMLTITSYMALKGNLGLCVATNSIITILLLYVHVTMNNNVKNNFRTTSNTELNSTALQFLYHTTSTNKGINSTKQESNQLQEILKILPIKMLHVRHEL